MLGRNHWDLESSSLFKVSGMGDIQFADRFFFSQFLVLKKDRWIRARSSSHFHVNHVNEPKVQTCPNGVQMGLSQHWIALNSWSFYVFRLNCQFFFQSQFNKFSRFPHSFRLPEQIPCGFFITLEWPDLQICRLRKYADPNLAPKVTIFTQDV